ncbi:MAG: hypothetical protein HKN23_10200, partial [Verrucomicrobiales bacterium]|nr:hypothetical protein [Verrucomicrobiales bacterium]
MSGSFDKREVRRRNFAAIRELADEQKSAFSAAIRDHLADWPPFQAARTVGVYIALPSEPDLGPLIW